MRKQPKESEVRQLLSRALRRRRRQSDSPTVVRMALQLNLNRELDDEVRGDTFKYFAAVLIVGALLFIFYSRIGLG